MEVVEGAGDGGGGAAPLLLLLLLLLLPLRGRQVLLGLAAMIVEEVDDQWSRFQSSLSRSQFYDLQYTTWHYYACSCMPWSLRVVHCDFGFWFRSSSHHHLPSSRIGDFFYAIPEQFLAQMKVHLWLCGTRTDFFIEGLNDVGMVVVTCRLC